MVVELMSELSSAWLGIGVVGGMLFALLLIMILYAGYKSGNNNRDETLKSLKNKDDVEIMKAYWRR